LKEKRAQERKSAVHATMTDAAGEVTITPAAVQKTEQEKILEMLNRFHKRQVN